MAYETGKRIVDMVREDLKPSDILTREAFENAIVAAARSAPRPTARRTSTRSRATSASSSTTDDWERIGYDIPLLVNCMPAGEYLGEAFHRAGGVPAVMRELLQAASMHGECADGDRQDHRREPARRARSRTAR